MFYRTLILNELVRADSYRISKEEIIDIAKNQDVDRKTDYVWCAFRDAKCYAQITIAGRRYINDLIKYGYKYDPLEMCIDHFYGRELVDFNRDAHFWHIILSPIAENEAKPKIWIKFPDNEEPVWFTIGDYSERDGFALSPNPRTKYISRWFSKFKGEFEALVKENPKTFAKALAESNEYFNAYEINRPSDSYEYCHLAMLVHPFPEKKAGDGTKYGIYVHSLDFVNTSSNMVLRPL